MKLLGSHQVINAATAIGAVEALGSLGIKIGPDAIRDGVGSVKWPGRLEIVSRNPLVILDGAHNRSSAAALAKSVRNIFKYKKLILALGVSGDKDVKGILEELLPLADSVVLTKSNVAARAFDPKKMAELIKDKKFTITSNVEGAIKKARLAADPEDLILITGSLFVVGEAREILTR